MTDEEISDLTNRLRSYMAQEMKIEVAPWIKDYVTDMENLYTNLCLERRDYIPHRRDISVVQDYRDLFLPEMENEAQIPELDQGSELKKPRKERSLAEKVRENKKIRGKKTKCPRMGKKILTKGDPGNGKSTFCKKVAWDWGRGIFTAYSIVFFVVLKLVQPGDAIENVIIQQMPVLESLGPKKLQSILRLYGSDCLLILDGLDKHYLEQNEDVLKIIKGQKYLNCSILLTSRPHSTKEIERYFDTVVRVQGIFTESGTDVCLEDLHQC